MQRMDIVCCLYFRFSAKLSGVHNWISVVMPCVAFWFWCSVKRYYLTTLRFGVLWRDTTSLPYVLVFCEEILPHYPTFWCSVKRYYLTTIRFGVMWRDTTSLPYVLVFCEEILPHYPTFWCSVKRYHLTTLRFGVLWRDTTSLPYVLVFCEEILPHYPTFWCSVKRYYLTTLRFWCSVKRYYLTTLRFWCSVKRYYLTTLRFSIYTLESYWYCAQEMSLLTTLSRFHHKAFSLSGFLEFAGRVKWLNVLWYRTIFWQGNVIPLPFCSMCV